MHEDDVGKKCLQKNISHTPLQRSNDPSLRITWLSQNFIWLASWGWPCAVLGTRDWLEISVVTTLFSSFFVSLIDNYQPGFEVWSFVNLRSSHAVSLPTWCSIHSLILIVRELTSFFISLSLKENNMKDKREEKPQLNSWSILTWFLFLWYRAFHSDIFEIDVHYYTR